MKDRNNERTYCNQAIPQNSNLTFWKFTWQNSYIHNHIMAIIQGQPVLAGTHVKNWRIFLQQSCTAHVPLLTATTLWVNKKQATIILPKTLPISWLILKILSLTESLVNLQQNLHSVPPHFNPVTTLPCEISVFKNCNAQDPSVWSKLSCKTQPLETVDSKQLLKIPYSDFSII